MKKSALEQVSFHDILLFETIAQQGSFSAAARELKLRAPFVTKAMQRLEKNLQLSLVKRSALGITLTVEGIEFLGFCRRIRESVENADWSTKKESQKDLPLLTVAAPSYLQLHLLAPALGKSMRLQNFNVRLLDLFPTQMLATGTREFLDAALHVEEPDWGKAWKSYPLGTVEWVLCVSANHPLGARASEKEVQRYPFVFPAALTAQGFRLGTDNCPLPLKQRQRGSEVTTSEIGLRLVEHSEQLIFLPEIQARQWVAEKRIRLVRVQEWEPVRKNIYLSAHQDKMTQKLVRLFIDTLSAALQS